MNNKEAIEIIDMAIAEVEWDYTMDYAVAFDMAKEALQERIDNENKINNEEALNICKQAIKYIAIKYNENNDKNLAESLCKRISEEIDIQIMIDAIEKQKTIKQKINWLKSFDQYDTMSIKEVIDAFEDCEIDI